MTEENAALEHRIRIEAQIIQDRLPLNHRLILIVQNPNGQYAFMSDLSKDQGVTLLKRLIDGLEDGTVNWKVA